MSLKNILIKSISKNSKLYQFLEKIYHYRTWKPDEIKDLYSILKSFNSYKKEDVFFIHIGANDGLNGDPIYEFVKNHNWKGILVEPIPRMFMELKKNYQANSSNLIFENVAVASNDKFEQFIYSVENTDNFLPYWVNQLSSFDKNVILKHIEYHPEIQERIIKIPIEVASFEKLITRNKVNHIDLVLIDTEGYDYEILKQIDLAKYSPGIIIYEHKHLSENDYKQSINELKSKGYKLYFCQGDTIAVQKDLFEKIIA